MTMPDGFSRDQPAKATGDMFLKLETARQGPIKGEAHAAEHGEEVELVGWSWGMEARTAMAAAGPAGKATVKELRILKHTDKASAPMMQTLRNNDAIKKAVLTQRKSGKTPQDYLRITLQDGRLTHFDVQSGPDHIVPLEAWHLSFKRISVEYREQLADGQLGGGVVFEDVIG
jgi:type VI secretion system secreted protein Hcp